MTAVVNEYGYVGGNPISRRDPKGLIDNDDSDFSLPPGVIGGEEKSWSDPGNPQGRCMMQCIVRVKATGTAASTGLFAALGRWGGQAGAAVAAVCNSPFAFGAGATIGITACTIHTIQCYPDTRQREVPTLGGSKR